MKYKDVEKLIDRETLRDKAFDWATDFVMDKLKTHFGIVMKFNTYNEVAAISSILIDMDKTIKKHIVNSYTYGGTKQAPLIEGKQIIRIKKHNSFIYVSGVTKDTNQNEMHSNILIYIFGKGAYKTKAYIDYKFRNFNDAELINYAVTASKRGTDSYWNCIANDIPPRTFDTLFFDNNVIGSVKGHLDKWLSNIDIYKSRNLNFKTGILIHGPAGTGKSSLAVAIASYLKCNLISIDMATFDDLDITDLTGSINADKDRYVVFLDEIDVVFKSRDENITDEQRERTTKLLTFLDSANSPTNVVFVATTNYPDRLDTAVTRKGRFDLIVHVDNLSKETAEEMCRGFNTTLNNVDISPLSDGKYNPATLQAAILSSMEQKNITTVE